MGMVEFGRLTGIPRVIVFQSDCAMIPAGCIRGNTQYPPDKKFITYSDLESEVRTPRLDPPLLSCVKREPTKALSFPAPVLSSSLARAVDAAGPLEPHTHSSA